MTRRLHVREHEVRNGALEDHAESFRVYTPSHNIERVRPQILAGRLDTCCAAISGAQHHGGSPIAEQAGGNDIGLGQLVVANGERAKFERDQEHVGAWPGLRQSRCNGQSRDAAGAAEPKHRHARHIRSEAKPAGDAGLKRRGGDAGRTHRNDGVDVVGRKIGALDSLLRDFDEQCFRAIQKGLSSLRPATRLAIPFNRFNAVAVLDASVGEKADNVSNCGYREPRMKRAASRICD